MVMKLPSKIEHILAKWQQNEQDKHSLPLSPTKGGGEGVVERGCSKPTAS